MEHDEHERLHELGIAHEHDHDHAHGHKHPHVHENQKLVSNRLARAIGHLQKVKRMVDESEDCSEVLIQLAAVRAALESTGKVILQDHIRHCIVDAVEEGDEQAITDLCAAIDKIMSTDSRRSGEEISRRLIELERENVRAARQLLGC